MFRKSNQLANTPINIDITSTGRGWSKPIKQSANRTRIKIPARKMDSNNGCNRGVETAI